VEFQKGQELIGERGIYSTEPEILNIFAFNITHGSKDNALGDLNDIIISEGLAKKYFNTNDPIGEQLIARVNGIQVAFTVKAVFKDYPRLSTFKPQALIHSQYAVDDLQRAFEGEDVKHSYLLGFHTTYVFLDNAESKGAVEEKIDRLMEKHLDANRKYSHTLQPMSEFYFHSNDIVNNHLPQGNLGSIYLFSLIAALILSVAIINYIILSVARSINRSKEIGLRRVVGASRSNVVLQLLGESAIIVMLSAIIGIPLVLLTTSSVQKFFNTNLEFSLDNPFIYYLGFAGIALVLAIISGLLISRHYASINPIAALKNKMVSGNGKSYLRSSLIVVQVSIFIGLLSSMLIIRNQINYAVRSDPGFNKENLLFLPTDEVVAHYEAIKQELGKHPAVLNISGATILPATNDRMVFEMASPDDPNIKTNLEGMPVDFHFFETMGMKIVEGRGFDPTRPTDSTNAILLSETAVKKLGLKDPINKVFKGGKTIIGVVKDFNFHSFHEPFTPIWFDIMPKKYADNIVIRFDPSNLEKLISHIINTWKRFSPEAKPQYIYYTDLAREMYEEEKQLSNILMLFSACAIFIALLGLFGLTVFITERRVKEIGIRKVQGALPLEIVKLISGGFIPLVIISGIISTPVVLYFMGKWLNRFAFRTPIDWWIFVASTLVALAFVLMVTVLKTYRASLVNPTAILRYE